MPVIGRLDKQVDDTLISPIEKRNKPKTADDLVPTEPDEHAPTQTHTQATHESSKNSREELPVWLL